MKDNILAITDIANITTGYHFRKSITNDTASKYYVLQAKNINDYYEIDYTGLEKTSITTNNIDKYLLKKKDVIMLAKGVNYYSALINKDLKNFVPTSNLLVIRAKNNNIMPEYLWWYLNHPNTQNTLKQMSQGVAVRHISKSAMEELEIPIPDIETQKRIVILHMLSKREEQLRKNIHRKKEMFLNRMLLNKAKRSKE
ncbi:restriction endonuclease subunit S [Candidatus Margulisiibacteriota bacterium]